MGIDRIRLAATHDGQTGRIDAFVVTVADSHRVPGRRLTSELRRGGLSVDMTDRPRPMKAQFREADRSGARVAIVVGDEWFDGNVTIRRLDSGEQEIIAVKEIQAWLQS
jgi:histidyl-tRNA synthetase